MQIQNLSRWLIVFDLDGTLVDTAPDLIASLNTVLAEEGLKPAPTTTALRKQTGQGAKSLIEYAAKQSGVLYSDNKITEMAQLLTKIYSENIARYSLPFPGTENALQQLQNSGAHLAVCTNKEGWLARKLLQSLNLLNRFSAVTGHDETPNRKPHRDHLLTCVSQARCQISHTIMIGDSPSDVGTARHNNVPVILVDFGYSLQNARELGGNTVISQYDSLYTTILRLIACTP